MTDEKFTFIEDLRDKKKTATGAHHKRTHCGKGGAVKFPSDFMTKKEIAAMSGEVKSYKLNDPMTWEEFKALPSDLATTYIKALRDKYGVSDSKIFEMMGINQATGQRYIAKLGIGLGKGGFRNKPWDKDGWCAWVNGVPKMTKEKVVETVREENVDGSSWTPEEQERIFEEATKQHGLYFRFDNQGITLHREVQIAPCRGEMTLQGEAANALETVKNLLGNSVVKLTVIWESA